MPKSSISRGSSSSTKPANKNSNSLPTSRKPRRTKQSRKRNRRSFIRYAAAPFNTSVFARTYSRITQTQTPGHARLSYCELFPVTYHEHGLSFFLIMNPSKWVGTRTQTQAMIYSQFRPLKIHASFVPTVGTATNGMFSFGAAYNNAYPDYTDDLYMRLPQMEGGYITSIWHQSSSEVHCRTLLFQNNYSLGDVTVQDIPLTLIGMLSGTSVSEGTVMGYVAVSGVFDLSAPRTTGLSYIAGVAEGTATVNDSGNVVLSVNKINQLENVHVGDTLSAIVKYSNNSNPSIQPFQMFEWVVTSIGQSNIILTTVQQIKKLATDPQSWLMAAVIIGKILNKLDFST